MAEKMRCPKCGHEQSGQVECAACGLIFARYRQRQARLAANVSSKPPARPAVSSAPRLLAVAVLVFCTSLITWYFTARHDGGQNAPPATSVASSPRQSSEEADRLSASPPPQNAMAPAAAQSNAAAPANNAIINARLATVTVKTPWGSGSGFFVTDSYVVTNRHVVAARPEQLEEFRRQVESAKERIQLAEYNLAEFKKKLRQASGLAARLAGEDAKRYEEELQKAKEKLLQAQEQLEKMESGLQPSEITIVMPDNSEQAASYMVVSDQKDLALLTIFARNTAYLRPAPNGPALQAGDTLYAIGSPFGLPQTVTKGILSGYQRYLGTGGAADQLYIQTDAAINPGNSGGPLIDEKGYVRGVNTMIIRGTQGIGQGIGFAIPIEDVYQEFSSILR